MPTTLVEKVHNKQHLRHVLANKLTLPLTVLQELDAGHAVDPAIIRKAIRAMQQALALVDEAESDASAKDKAHLTI